MIFKLLMVVGFVSALIFLSYIYPNLKKPNWQRKLVSAGYLRIRGHGDLADNVIIKAIEKEPGAEKLYTELFNNYSAPNDMKKLYDIISTGAKKTGNPGVRAAQAWCLMEEGEFDRAEAILTGEDVMDYLTEYSKPYLPVLYFRKGDYAECEKTFLSFYKSVYRTHYDREPETEKEILIELTPDELIYLAAARRKLGKEWRKALSRIPRKSIHEEENWEAFYAKKREELVSLKVDTGIYGPPENLYKTRKKELEEITEILGEYMGKTGKT